MIRGMLFLLCKSVVVNFNFKLRTVREKKTSYLAGLLHIKAVSNNSMVNEFLTFAMTFVLKKLCQTLLLLIYIVLCKLWWTQELFVPTGPRRADYMVRFLEDILYPLKILHSSDEVIEMAARQDVSWDLLLLYYKAFIHVYRPSRKWKLNIISVFVNLRLLVYWTWCVV